MCCQSQSRTAREPSEIDQVFVSNSVFDILRSYATFVLRHSSFLKHPTVSLKSWRGEGIVLNVTCCWMMPLSILRERDGVSQTCPLFGLEVFLQVSACPWLLASQPRLSLCSFTLPDKSTANGWETEECTADMETLWNIEYGVTVLSIILMLMKSGSQFPSRWAKRWGLRCVSCCSPFWFLSPHFQCSCFGSFLNLSDLIPSSPHWLIFAKN